MEIKSKAIRLNLAWLMFLYCTGLQTSNALSQELQVTKIPLQAVFVDKDNRRVKSASLPKQVLLSMPLITGDYLGYPNTPPIFVQKITVGSQVTLNIDEQLETIAKLSAPISKEAEVAGLVVSPKQTRFARFASLASQADDVNKGVGSGKFQGEQADESLLMMYFDRPCKLSGVSRGSSSRTAFDVEIPKAGIYFIKLTPGGWNFRRATLSPAPTVLTLDILPR